jgi:hypothetical protein
MRAAPTRSRSRFEYTEKVGMPVLSILFQTTRSCRRAEHFYETDFVQR